MSTGKHDSEFLGVGGGGAQQPNYQQQGQQKVRFSPEEMRAIKECNRESFYYRCLPIGTFLGVGAYLGVTRGYLKASPRFGAGPKMMVGSIVGYFLGKFSYQSVCAEKLMALPNSQLGEMLRKRKGQMGFQETLTMEPSYASTAPVVGAPAFANTDFNRSSNMYSDVGDTRPMQGFDTEGSSNVSGYDLNSQSSASAANYDTTHQMLDDENLPAKRPQFQTTYDDLRRQNRIDYESKQYPSRNIPSSPAPDLQGAGGYDGPSTRRSAAPSYAPPENKARNKYGDIWEDKPSN